MQLRPLRLTDRIDVAKLYHSVSGMVKGISRSPEEITETWIFSLFNKLPHNLVGIVAFVEDEDGDEEIIGLAHAEKSGLICYDHILANFTVIVHPDYQNTGVGKKLGYEFLKFVATNRPDVKRLEMESRKDLMHHQTYMQAGFVKEGEVKERIRNLDGSFSDSILLVWINPNFKP